MSETPLPPVPAALREALKNYPEYLSRLQDTLNTLIREPAPGVDPFERAVWLLDGQIEAFYHEAQSELNAARAGGDARTVEAAKAKSTLMIQAGSKASWIADKDLSDYIRDHRRAFS